MTLLFIIIIIFPETFVKSTLKYFHLVKNCLIKRWCKLFKFAREKKSCQTKELMFLTYVRKMKLHFFFFLFFLIKLCQLELLL